MHVVGDYFTAGKSCPLEPDMVITDELGLYFPPEYDFLLAEVRGLTICTEDELLVTEKGYQVFTAACRS